MVTRRPTIRRPAAALAALAAVVALLPVAARSDLSAPPASGAMALLSTQIASNSASLAFTGLTQSHVKIYCHGLLPATTAGLTILVGEGSGPTWEAANYTYEYYSANGATIGGGRLSGQTSVGLYDGALNPAQAVNAVSLELDITDLASTAINKNFQIRTNTPQANTASDTSVALPCW